MQKIIYKVLLCGIIFCAVSCRKYVEIAPENTRVLELTSDYQQLLYNTTTTDRTYFMPLYAGDDMGTADVRWQNSLSLLPGNIYTWAAKNYTATEEDQEWQYLYQQLYLCNSITEGIMDSKGGTENQKKAVLSSALVHRAFIYYTLVNLYAKQYDPATAATDPGVPLVLGTRFFTDLTRASVQKVYDQIQTDLTQALPNLPNLPDFNSNPSKAAAYAILARVYLNTREFSEAERNANLALGLQSTLLDLKAYLATPRTYPGRIANPEEILLKKAIQTPVSFPLSEDVLSLFSTTDLRYVLFTVPGTGLWNPTFDTRAYNNNQVSVDGIFVGPCVPEMMLIKAECEARAGNVETSLSVVNALRIKRFKTEDYMPLTASTANEALHQVINERRREFVGRGFRWFDQRRLSKDAGFISAVTRSYRGQTYTLEPGSNKYIFPIGDKYILLNPEIVQNPR
ncbi:RagB/SusD family nutrient uptake outer membrane protein [Pedobacter sp. AW31-3R]|uniref:RagB/SusD family nutrient uptake outer membrane protein n=1 Tax=Pedobacter sp. AW31-3R TaxID=3445781 RepID=UPI003FA0BF3D